MSHKSVRPRITNVIQIIHECLHSISIVKRMARRNILKNKCIMNTRALNIKIDYRFVAARFNANAAFYATHNAMMRRTGPADRVFIAAQHNECAR